MSLPLLYLLIIDWSRSECTALRRFDFGGKELAVCKELKIHEFNKKISVLNLNKLLVLCFLGIYWFYTRFYYIQYSVIVFCRQLATNISKLKLSSILATSSFV